MANIQERLQEFLNGLSEDVVEERVIEYVIREVRNGRKLTESLKDPYVKNRLNEERLSHVLESPEVIAALERQIAESFERKEFGFAD